MATSIQNKNKMKYITSLLLVLISIQLIAQTQADFDLIGSQVFETFTDSTTAHDLSLIKIREYNEVIDKQPWGDYQKDALKQQIDMEYTNMYARYQREMSVLAINYSLEVEDGAKFEYLKTEYEEKEGMRHFYYATTTFGYSHKKVQTRVRFNYEIAWLGQFFVLTTGVKEDF